MTGEISFNTLKRSVPDHEILLVFDGDDDAERFSDWLQGAGWAAFGEWARSEGGDTP